MFGETVLRICFAEGNCSLKICVKHEKADKPAPATVKLETAWFRIIIQKLIT